MALQCITIVWPKTHENCQRDRDEVNGFLVFFLERREAEHVLVTLPRSQQAVSHGSSCSQVESLGST